MNFAEYYYRVINWPGRTALRRRRWRSPSAAARGRCRDSQHGQAPEVCPGSGHRRVVVIMALALDRPRADRHGEKELHTSRYDIPVYRASRLALLVALVALPVAASVVMSSVFVSTRRRLRELVPSRLKEGRRHHVAEEIRGRPSRIQRSHRDVAPPGRSLFPARLALSDDGREIARPGRFRACDRARSAVRASLPPARQDLPRKRRFRFGPRRLRHADDPPGQRPRDAT